MTPRHDRPTNRHREPLRGIRGAPKDLVEAFDAAAGTAGSNRSAITCAFWAWYAGLPGAQLPQRPTP